MTELDAVQAYRTALRSTYVSRDGDECGRTYDLVDEDAADAAIAALEAELERLKVCGSCEHCNPKGPWCREAGNLWNFEAAEAGWDWLLTDGSIDDRVGLHFKCHFTPSRWTERGAE